MKNYRKYLGLFYIVAAFIVIPLYNKGTFENIGQHKVEAFYLVNGIFFAANLMLNIISVFKVKKESNSASGKVMTSPNTMESPENLDIAVSIFVFMNFVSLLFSGNVKAAFYGVPDMGMGFLSILIMGIVYFYIARNNNLTEPVIHAIAISSVFPTVLTILNRLGFDPLNMYYEGENIKTNLYVSTLGNYGAFSTYMSIIIPIVCFMALFAENKKVRYVYMALLLADIVSIMMVGTLATKVVTIFAVGIVLFWKIMPQIYIYHGVVIAVCALCGLVYALIISIEISNPDFANGRGFIWEITRELFRSFPIRQKIIGAGTNCYMYSLSDFLMTNPKYLSACNERFGDIALTSAHSEYLDYLINTGLTGILSYCYVIYSALRTYAEKEEKDKFFRLSFLCIASYLINASVNYSNVLSTPFFFVFLGTLSYGKRTCDR